MRDCRAAAPHTSGLTGVACAGRPNQGRLHVEACNSLPAQPQQFFSAAQPLFCPASLACRSPRQQVRLRTMPARWPGFLLLRGELQRQPASITWA